MSWSLAMMWIWKHFDELNVHELYQILRLRSEVFILEQKIAYLDPDGLDLISWHLMGLRQSDERLAAYARITPRDSRFPEISIGRVVVSPERRGTGLGQQLMTVCIKEIADRFGEQPLRISAQAYLENFYSNFGFQRCSDEYLEDQIPHIEMLRASHTLDSKPALSGKP